MRRLAAAFKSAGKPAHSKALRACVYNRRVKRWIGATAVAFLLSAAGCGRGERAVPATATFDDTTPRPGGTLVRRLEGDVATLNPVLSTSRYEVIEAAGGYDGLRLARQAQPDVIFLDLMMPDIHGFEVLKMLKAIEDTRRIPVVLFTSQVPEREDELERGAAADALLLKNELSRDTVTSTMQRIRGMTENDHARHP